MRMKNGLSYFSIMFFSLLAHLSLLLIVFVRGRYDSITDPMILSVMVLSMDIGYFIFLRFMKQNTYAFDILLVTVLGISLIFQSCFGKVGFSIKHFIFCIVALAMVQLGFKIAQDFRLVEKYKASHITICAEEKIDWTLDGEFGGSYKEAEILISRQAVSIMRENR